MSDEGWTVDSLRIHFETVLRELRSALDTRVTAQVEAIKAALAAAEKAIDKAEVATEKRFDSVNEFRRALSDQTSTFMPRAETEQRIDALADRLIGITDRNITSIADLALRMQTVPTPQERHALNAATIARDEALSERLNKLELRVNSRLDLSAGRASGVSATVASLIAVTGLVISVAAIVTLVLLHH